MNNDLDSFSIPSTPEQPRSKRKKIIWSIISTIIGLALVIGIILILSHLFQNLEQKQITQDSHLLVQGSLKSTETDLNSKLAGTIQDIQVEEGDQVEEGQVLLTLDSGELQAKVSQAQAAVSQAKAGVRQAEANLGQAEASISQTQSKVKQAEAAIGAAQSQSELAIATRDYAQTQYDKAQNGARAEEINQLKIACDLAESTYNRIKELYAAGASTAYDYDQAESSYLVAKEQYEEALNGSRPEDIAAASASVAEAEAGIKAAASQVAQAEAAKKEAESGLAQAEAAKKLAQAAVEQAKAVLSQAEAALQEAQVYLGYATIKAPTSGTVTALNIEKGELVSSGMALLTISDLSSMWVEVNVDETDLGSIRLQDQVKVTLPSFPDQIFTGTITKISQNPDFAISRATNAKDDFDILSYAVKIEISDLSELASSPGMTVVIDFGQVTASDQAEDNSNVETAD